MGSHHAYGWGKVGHEVIAQIADDNLTPKAKSAVDSILKNDPEQRDLFASSTWPDEIRRDSSVPDDQKHPRRHFVDVPIVNNALPSEADRLKLYADPETVTYGIKYYAAQLRLGTLSPGDRANDLSWLIHLVGDIHQPLHCATLITAQYPAPDGDRGGNEEMVTGPDVTRSGDVVNRELKLHAFWDYSPELLLPGGNPVDLAHQLEKAHPESSYGDAKTASSSDANNWADESATLALYAFSAQDGSTLTSAYVAQTNVIVSDRLAHAGYRLASVLNQIFK